jgi:CRP-like cAMP-binding protein
MSLDKTLARRPGARRVEWPAGSLLAELDRLGGNGRSDHLRRTLEQSGTGRVYARGETMLMEGAPDTDVLVLLDGFAKVRAGDAAGCSVLVDIRAAGDVVGELAAFDGRPRSATVVAEHQMYVRRISQQDWLSWLAADPMADLALNRSIAHRGRIAVRRRTAFVRGPVVARLSCAVLDLADQYGAPGAEGLLVRPGLTQQEWAELIGARERRVQHALRELAQAGVISFGRRRITVRSVAGLREFAALEGTPW